MFSCVNCFVSVPTRIEVVGRADNAKRISPTGGRGLVAAFTNLPCALAGGTLLGAGPAPAPVQICNSDLVLQAARAGALNSFRAHDGYKKMIPTTRRKRADQDAGTIGSHGPTSAIFRQTITHARKEQMMELLRAIMPTRNELSAGRGGDAISRIAATRAMTSRVANVASFVDVLISLIVK